MILFFMHRIKKDHFIWILLITSALAFSSFNHLHILYNDQINLQLKSLCNQETVALSNIFSGFGKILSIFISTKNSWIYLLFHAIIVWICGFTSNIYIFYIFRLLQGFLAGIIMGVVFGEMGQYAKQNKNIFLLSTAWTSFFHSINVILVFVLPYWYMNLYVCIICTICFFISFVTKNTQLLENIENNINIKDFFSQNIIKKLIMLIIMSWIIAYGIVNILTFSSLKIINNNFSPKIVHCLKCLPYILESIIGFSFKYKSNQFVSIIILVIINIICIFLINYHFIFSILSICIGMICLELVCSVINNELSYIINFNRNQSILFFAIRSILTGIFIKILLNNISYNIIINLISILLLIVYKYNTKENNI